MRWLVDIDRLVADGDVTPAIAALMKQRARDEALALGINSVLGAGILAVIGGTLAFFEDAGVTLIIGLFLMAAGVAALARVAGSARLIAVAAAVTGLATALGGASYLLADPEEGSGPLIWLGGAVALTGLGLRGIADARFTSFAGWAAVLGAGLHLGGVFASEGALYLAPVAWLWAGTVTLALGALLDIRLLTALSVAAYAASLSSGGYVGGGGYVLSIFEPTLLILALAPLALGAAWLARRAGERTARHARIWGLMAFIWINLGFWVASIWGDDVGVTLIGLGQEEAPEPIVAIPAVVFAVGWAGVVLVVGCWAALSARRSAFNAAATFGAIHFYTQWFERLDANPGAIIVAGLVAIGAAWALYRANQWLLARRDAPTGGSAPQAPDAASAGGVG